ncbi:MAG: hypothetical protein WDW38_009226 [Sanguina aurantia]
MPPRNHSSFRPGGLLTFGIGPAARLSWSLELPDGLALIGRAGCGSSACTGERGAKMEGTGALAGELRTMDAGTTGMPASTALRLR